MATFISRINLPKEFFFTNTLSKLYLMIFASATNRNKFSSSTYIGRFCDTCSQTLVNLFANSAAREFCPPTPNKLPFDEYISSVNSLTGHLLEQIFSRFQIFQNNRSQFTIDSTGLNNTPIRMSP